jgi:hypothetical protein
MYIVQKASEKKEVGKWRSSDVGFGAGEQAQS